MAFLNILFLILFNVSLFANVPDDDGASICIKKVGELADGVHLKFNHQRRQPFLDSIKKHSDLKDPKLLSRAYVEFYKNAFRSLERPYDTAIMIGNGRFASAMAEALARNFKKVYMLVQSSNPKTIIEKHRELIEGKSVLLEQDEALPFNIIPIVDWTHPLEDLAMGEVQLLAYGSSFGALRPVLKNNKKQLSEFIEQGLPLISLSKGIDPKTSSLPLDIYEEVFGKEVRNQIFFASGGSFAKEILMHRPTEIDLAGNIGNDEIHHQVINYFRSAHLGVKKTTDIYGVQIAGAAKNVYAIASGILGALTNSSQNSHAILVRRGQKEIKRLIEILGGDGSSFDSPSGIGDFIITTGSQQSRNYQYGNKLVRAYLGEDVDFNENGVAEGVENTKALFNMVDKHPHVQIEKFPVLNAVYHILFKKDNPEILQRALIKQY